MTTFVVTIDRVAIALWGVIQKRSYELMYKNNTKKGKRLRATTFAIAKLEERLLNGE